MSDDAARRPAQEKSRAENISKRETIMLVEDEEIMRNFLSTQLRSEGYPFIVAVDGEAALSMSENYPDPIHLLITDVMMPLMNGKELADRLCALRPDIRVLFISGFSRRDVFPNDVCEDQTDWLPKPFTGIKFHDTIRKILD